MSPVSSSAVASLYRDHLGWLRTLLCRRLGCSETAADLAQDTFVRLLHRDRAGVDLREPRAYLTRIAQGLLANHWRRQDIERAYLDALRDRPPTLAVSPEERQLVLETLYRVDARLSALPARARRAFLMSRLDGLGYRAIGERLGVSERMVKKYMARAMLECLRLVDEGADEEARR